MEIMFKMLTGETYNCPCEVKMVEHVIVCDLETVLDLNVSRGHIICGNNFSSCPFNNNVHRSRRRRRQLAYLNAGG